MFEIHELHPLLDARLVDKPKTGTDNLTNAIATTGWLAAGMIHDFRNPLGTIRSASEILLDVDVNAAQLKRLARNMHHAATRMQELLTDLTDSLRGNLAPPEIGSLREIILAASKTAHAMPQENVRVFVDVPAGLRLPLRPSCIQRVFVNLLHNSFDAMPKGGEITIVARRSGDPALIDLQDSGPGIPSSIRGRLFQPFVTEGKPRGLGLGLALARQAVLSHGGSMVDVAGGGKGSSLCDQFARC
jgi:two-component system, sporulation sensor kinase E